MTTTPPPPYLSRCPSFYKLPSDSPPPYPYSDVKHAGLFGAADHQELARKLAALAAPASSTPSTPTSPTSPTSPASPTAAPMRRQRPRRPMRICNPDSA
ncbi:hypothetical protein CALCODRAFT_501869 [Calocera cornea HHB12733]|uniref:Uncharacterized protein n=1 Tax=Calocera cornea HHB12733 TaxID=1353952 RepID=A0A165DHF9_9BASI|nr:hypothetical protein CALCODRAFT_501869 [Calocera cornea HHB12733]